MTGQQPTARAHRPLHSHADRDEVKRRAEADFESLAEEHGATRRGRTWLCPFHEDRNPSASIRCGRFHCFTCGITLDPIGFIQRARGEDFKGALAFLADRYGVPLNRPLSLEAKRAYAQERADQEKHSLDAELWRIVAVLFLEGALEERKAVAFGPAAGVFYGSEPTPRDIALSELPRLTATAARLGRLTSAELVREYREWAATYPALTEAMVRAAERYTIAQSHGILAYFLESEAVAA